jgi:hypothetical protein
VDERVAFDAGHSRDQISLLGPQEHLAPPRNGETMDSHAARLSYGISAFGFCVELHHVGYSLAFQISPTLSRGSATPPDITILLDSKKIRYAVQ